MKKHDTIVKISEGYFWPLWLEFFSSEGASVQDVDFGWGKGSGSVGGLSEEIPAQTGIDLEGLGRPVFFVSVAVVFAGLARGSGEQFLAVEVEVHGFFGYYF